MEDLAVGMRATIRKTVENEDVIGFAELSGDHNPIHLSEHFARKTRFGGRIVHGLYTASLISGVIGMRLPGPGAVYISQTLNFLGPVKIGDVVDVSVEVAELTEKNRRVRLHCECRVGDRVVLDGEGVLFLFSWGIMLHVVNWTTFDQEPRSSTPTTAAETVSVQENA